MLTLQNSWYEDGHHFVRWRPVSQGLLRAAKLSLGKQLKSYLSLRCTHVKGRGGAKASVRFAQTMTAQYCYVARFDIHSYYESMNHAVLLKLLEETGVDAEGYALVSDYLRLPDMKLTGCGMVAGGSISPLLGAVYLTPLDRAMEKLQPRHDIRYQRFMDDYLIFAPTRHKLKAAQGVDENRLRQYIQRWFSWLHSGLRNRVSNKGGFNRIWLFVLKHLKITGYLINPP